MRAQTGAILILAGAVLFGAGVVGQEIALTSSRTGDTYLTFWSMFVGVIIALTGLAFLWRDRSNPLS